MALGKKKAEKSSEADVESDFEDSIQIPEENIELPRVASKHEVDVKACPVRNVTVFIDRAEVNREVGISAVPGDCEVLVQNLPSVIDKDSIRVTCYGEATIVEVAYQEKAISEKVETEDELESIKSEADKVRSSIKKLEGEKSRLLEKVESVKNEKDALEEYRVCISASKDDKVVDVLEKKNVENLLSFLNIYKERSEKLMEASFSLNEKLEAINKEIDVLKKNLDGMGPQSQEITMGRRISILLDVKEKGSVTLVVSYVVSNASWTPLYDVRAFNKDSSVQVLYFANIKQNTGEDWEDAKLSLSTAMPSVGGSPPELQPQVLNLAVRYNLVPEKKQYRRFSMRKRVSGLMDNFGSLSSAPAYAESSLPEAMTVEGITSTNFEITRLATIQSDDVAHKVSIAQLDFSPQFEYLSTPKAVAHAFLKIKAKNESAYAMLAGDANVFLDNNFITKSSLPSVSPMEEFEVALGADPAVKVTYNPLKKFEQKTGMISKAHVYNFHQQIEIKNTKSSPIKITIQDQCPRSTNEKIRVTLQEPNMNLKASSPNEPAVVQEGNATLHTNDYKIEWVCDIAASETKKIDLRYQVEHPVGVDIAGL